MLPEPDCPADLRDLTQGQHLVIWAMRAFATGQADCPLVARVFESVCGAHAGEARLAFLVFVQRLGLRGRHRICVGAPGRLELTGDEQRMAALFADAQAHARDRFDARLAVLLGRPPEASFFAAAQMVTRALALEGRLLQPFPWRDAPDAPDVPDALSDAA